MSASLEDLLLALEKEHLNDGAWAMLQRELLGKKFSFCSRRFLDCAIESLAESRDDERNAPKFAGMPLDLSEMQKVLGDEEGDGKVPQDLKELGKFAQEVAAGSQSSLQENQQVKQSNSAFITASEKLKNDAKLKRKRTMGSSESAQNSIGKKPVIGLKRNKNANANSNLADNIDAPSFVKRAIEDVLEGPEGKKASENVPEQLKNIDPKLIEMIESEIMDNGSKVTWEDIAGLNFAKKCVMEIVVWPMLRPDLFQGLRGPPKGILLFGPPGTGKTLIGKAIASEVKATFFSISASSLTSKWHGEGEKLVRTLFAVASCHQPAVIFIDEIDSLLAQRSESDFEGSRRIKTEFLVQLDGARTCGDERILVIGATNRPQELDEAARRRLVKKLYIPLPDSEGRKALIHSLMDKEAHTLTAEDVDKIVTKSLGYSGADMRALCTEAAYGPIRELVQAEVRLDRINQDAVRPIAIVDFEAAFHQVRPSVSSDDLRLYVDWNDKFGSFPNQADP